MIARKEWGIKVSLAEVHQSIFNAEIKLFIKHGSFKVVISDGEFSYQTSGTEMRAKEHWTTLCFDGMAFGRTEITMSVLPLTVEALCFVDEWILRYESFKDEIIACRE